jgi:hypothetical protein
MGERHIYTRSCGVLFGLLVALAVMLAAASAAGAHPRAPWVTAERVERALDRTRFVQLSICNGLGRPRRPALPINRRFRHFGCVMFDRHGDTWCAVVHTLPSGGLRVGRLWPGFDPRTPARACGAN